MTHLLTRVVLTEPSLTVGLLPRSLNAGGDVRAPSITRSLPLPVLTSSRAEPLLTRGLLTLLTLAVPTIPTEIAAARMLQLAVAFGADTNHCGHS